MFMDVLHVSVLTYLSSQTELSSNSHADKSEIRAEPYDWPWDAHGAPSQEGKPNAPFTTQH